MASLVLCFAPTLVQEFDPAPDLFEAVERHVRWGLGVSLGMVLVVKPWKRPWTVVVAWAAFCLSAGYLLARFVGLALEGADSNKQWMLVGVEVALCAVAALWIRHRRDAPNRPPKA